MIQDYRPIERGACNEVVRVVGRKPIPVGIAANKELIFYSRGLFDNNDRNVNHAVVLVGFKSDTGYKIQNSWGIQWG